MRSFTKCNILIIALFTSAVLNGAENRQNSNQQRQSMRSDQSSQQDWSRRVGYMPLVRKVQQTLKQSDFGDKFNVTADFNSVRIFGRVQSQNQKDQINLMIAQINGIQDVTNDIIVNEEGWQPPTGQQLLDEVKENLFWSWFVDEDDVTVEVQDNIVTLRGTVENLGEINDAIYNAYDGGAQYVRNRLIAREIFYGGWDADPYPYGYPYGYGYYGYPYP